jgi:transposase
MFLPSEQKPLTRPGPKSPQAAARPFLAKRHMTQPQPSIAMHPDQTRNKFIELRSREVSFQKIADELGISKSTAVSWGQQYKAEIENLQAVEREALQQRLLGSIEERLQTAVARVRRYEQELDKRDTKYLPTLEVHKLLADARRELNKLVVQPVFTKTAAETHED